MADLIVFCPLHFVLTHLAHISPLNLTSCVSDCKRWARNLKGRLLWNIPGYLWVYFAFCSMICLWTCPPEKFSQSYISYQYISYFKKEPQNKCDLCAHVTWECAPLDLKSFQCISNMMLNIQQSPKGSKKPALINLFNTVLLWDLHSPTDIFSLQVSYHTSEQEPAGFKRPYVLLVQRGECGCKTLTQRDKDKGRTREGSMEIFQRWVSPELLKSSHWGFMVSPLCLTWGFGSNEDGSKPPTWTHELLICSRLMV